MTKQNMMRSNSNMYKMRTNRKLFKRADAWEFTNEHNQQAIQMFADGTIIIRYFARYKRFESIEELIRTLKQ